MRLLLVFLLLLNAPFPVWGQYTVKVEGPDGEGPSAERLAKDLGLKQAYPDSITARQGLREFLVGLYANGYLAATIDSLAFEAGSVRARVSPGVTYRLAKISPGNVDEGILSEAGFREKVYRNKPVSLRTLASIQEKLLDWCDANGYPFATIRYDSLQVVDGKWSAVLHLQKNGAVTLDSVIVKGDAKLSRVYLYNYLSLKPGRPYDESLVKKIPTRIRELPMVKELRPMGLAFHEEGASLYLYLDNKRASQLDGVIGVQPDNSGSGKINVTGDVHIKLFSAFGYGELFDLNWKQPGPGTQDLQARFNYPFLFSSPFGIDLGLSIYKKDSTYLELNRSLGVQFQLGGTNYLKTFYRNKKSSLIDTEPFEQVTVLPPFADIRVNSYGLGLRVERLDYRYNPRRGYAVEVEGTAGRKTVERNARLKQVNYDSLDLKSTQFTATLAGEYYIPLASRQVVNLGGRAGLLHGDETFQNEMYRIGGLKTLRGFDEESILASIYAIWKAEFRYILEENSFLFLFVNGAWYERDQRDVFVTDTPIGFGAGITFETGLGIFSLNYALGREFENPVLIRAGKVHFGLVNYF